MGNASEPIMTATPTGRQQQHQQQLASSSRTSPSIGQVLDLGSPPMTATHPLPPGAGAGAGSALHRKPFQRTLSMPLANKLGPLQKPARSTQRVPTMRTMGNATPGLAPHSDSQSAASVSSSSRRLSEAEAAQLAPPTPGTGTGMYPAITDERSLYQQNASDVGDFDVDDAAPFPALLADTLQLSISTLLQLISPHLLDPSHERYSASSIQVPVTSIEALLESHRALNWLCARMDDFGANGPTLLKDAAQHAAGHQTRRSDVLVRNQSHSSAGAESQESEDIILVGSKPQSRADPSQETPAVDEMETADPPTSESPPSASVATPTTLSSGAPSSLLSHSPHDPISGPSTTASSIHLANPNSLRRVNTSVLGSTSKYQDSASLSASDPSSSAPGSRSDIVDFDIAELVQRAADAVSGKAAARGVELALCAPTYSMRKGEDATETSFGRALGISVRGDEGAVRFGMLHALGKIIDQCERGETVHAALCVTELAGDAGVAEETTAQGDNGKGKARDRSGDLQCCFHIYRADTTRTPKAASVNDSTPADSSKAESISEVRRQGLDRALSTKFLQSIACDVKVRDVPWPKVLNDHGQRLEQNGAAEIGNATTDGSNGQDRALQYTLYYYLQRGGPLLEAAAVDLRESFSRQRYLPSISVGREPSLRELVTFAVTELKAKGRTVALHAQADSAGAKQLISMLSSWGCSVALFPLPRVTRKTDPFAAAGLDLDLDIMEPLNAAEETGLWAGVPHEYGSPWQIHDGVGASFEGSAGEGRGDSDASLGSAVDALGLPLQTGSQRTLRTAVALVADGKPSLVSYPSGLHLPLLPPSSSGDGVRRKRESIDTVMGPEAAAFPKPATILPSATTPGSEPIDAAVLDPVTGVPLAVTPSQSTAGPTDKIATQDLVTAGLSSQIVPFSFVIIDDDVEVLQRELLRLQSAVPMLRSALGSPAQTPGLHTSAGKSPFSAVRPALPHRGTSNAQIQRVIAEDRGEPYVKQVQPQSPGAAPMQKVPSAADSSTYAIIHLTSIGNFRLVRDFVRSLIESTSAQQRAGLPRSLPEILVIPKPIGPRRLLTTLHTAVHKPLVDEFFVPIATSPLNPGMHSTQAGTSVWAEHVTRDSKLRSSNIPEPSTPPISASPRAELPTQLLHPSTPESSSLAIAPELERDATLIPPTSGLQPDAPVQAAVNQLRQKEGTGAKERPDDTLPLPSGSPGRTIPWSGASAAGKRSHPSSPLPMDALEYFNETASRMGSRAASGMVISSADGKSAGIFFRPGDHGRSQSGSSYQKNETREVVDSDQSSDPASVPSAQWPPPSQRGPDTVSRDASQKSPTAATTDSSSKRDTPTHRKRSTSTSQVVGARPFPSGSLFSPEVGIEAVLAGSAPPVATPLGPPTRHGSSANIWDSSPHPVRPGPAAVIAASGTPSGSSSQQSAGLSSPESSAPPPPSPGESPVARTLELPPENSGALGVANKPELRTSMSGGLARIPEDQPQSATSRHSHSQQLPPAAAPRAVAMTPQPSAKGSKPSALPQPGLLIGAGFAPKDKKFSAPKKSLLREPVLPPIKVLIVEDNPINQRIMAKFMDKKKIKYEIATNGRDAIERWQTGGFHLILMDIQLPVMDGIEATREIRRLERSANIGILPNTPPAHTPTTVRDQDWQALSPARQPMSPFRASVIIVALTASVFNPDRVAALAAGCNDYLTKPVNHNWLEKKIIEWGSMQYILLSGFPSDNWDRWREERKLDAATVAAGPGAKSQVAQTIRRGFNKLPEENARKLASKLHISRPPRSGTASPNPPGQAATVPGRITPGQPLRRPPPEPVLGRGGSGEGGPASTRSTASSGSSIRLNMAGQFGQLGSQGTAGSSGEGVPTLSTVIPTDASPAALSSPNFVPTPAPLGPPDEAEDGQGESATGEMPVSVPDNPDALLAIAPVRPDAPPTLSPAEAERIDDSRVTTKVPDNSAVQDLAGSG